MASLPNEAVQREPAAEAHYEYRRHPMEGDAQSSTDGAAQLRGV